MLPILLLIVIGTAEFGLAFKDWLSVGHATREGVRIASTMGNHVDADCETVKATIDALVAVDINQIDRIEIYRADAGGQQIMGDTNRWRYTSGDPTDCSNWAVIETWPSANRKVTVGSTPLDIAGVRVVFDHNWVTDFAMFSGTARFDESTILRLEPKAFE